MIISQISKIIKFINDRDGNLKSKVFRSGVWVSISTLTVNSLNFFRSIILARLLTPEIFGLMGISLIFIRGFELFTETGFRPALIHRQNQIEEAKNVTFTLMVLRGALLFIIGIIIAPLVSNYYQQPVLNGAIKILSISFIINGFFNINSVLLEKELDYKKLTILKQISNSLNFIFVISLAYYLRSVWALILGHLFAVIIETVLSYVLLEGKPKFVFQKSIAKELFKYGKFITGVTIIIYITTEFDNFIIGKILGMTELGYYLIAYTLANLPATHFSKVLSNILFPAYSKLQNDYVALKNAYFKALKIVLYVAIPFALSLIVIAPEFIGNIYGDRWLPAVDALRVLCIFGVIRAVSSISGYVYNAIGKPNITFYLVLGKLIVILAIIYPLTLKYGILGTSIAVTFPLIIEFTVANYIFCKILDFRLIEIFKNALMPLRASIVLVMILLLLKFLLSEINLPLMLVIIFSSILLYLILNKKELLGYFKEIRVILDKR